MVVGVLVVFLVAGGVWVARATARGNRAARVSALDFEVARAFAEGDFTAASAAADAHVDAVEGAYGATDPALVDSCLRAAFLRDVTKREGADALVARAVAIGEALPAREA